MRNLGLIISFWLAAISLPSQVLALGLGEIEVNSFLNQPLKAEIEVISARAGEIDDLLVGLASRDAFSRAGLSRTNNLSDLRFTVKKSEEGDSAVILVTTKGAIKEPFLNFLVEADWSKGRLLREFTILLDPPFYADSPAPAPQPEPVAEIETETVSQAEPTPEVPQPIVESTESTDVSSEQPEIQEPIAIDETETESSDGSSDVAEVLAMVESVDAEQGDITVSKGDTLWSIASGLQGSGHSMSQIMLAIQRANPEAFGDDNINNLKIGSVLRMPDASEIGVVDEQQAYAEVLQQNGLWDDYVARVTGVPAVSSEVETDSGSDSSELSQEAEATQETESVGELNLLTPGDGESDAAGLQSEGEDANELRVKLALAEEELDASRVENTELESRIAELEARLSKFEELQKMVEIEDDSLAKLQADQVQEEEIVSSETINEQQKTTDEDELLDELLSEDETTGEMEVVDSTESETLDSSDSMVEDEAVSESLVADETVAETGTGTDESDTMTDDSTEQEQTSTAPPVPVIVTESEPESTSLLDGIIPTGILDMLPSMGDIMPSGEGLALDPLMLGGLGGILLLLIGLVIYKRKKAAEEDDGEVMVNDPIFVADADDEDDLTPIHLAEGAFEGLEDDSDISLPDETGIAETLMGGSDDEADEEDDEFARTAIVSPDNMPEPEAPAAPAVEEQDDILNEADVYLAYNLYDNAEELLTQSLEANPERADYRSKLLDTHFATKNTDAFIREAETLKSMGGPADRYWDRVLVMGHELAPDNALFAGAKDAGISAADLEISKPAAADFDLGASEDDTNFSTTDFDLGEEDTNTFEATDFSSADIGSETDTATAEVSEDDTNINAGIEEDVPDEIGDLDFSFDSDDSSAEAEVDDDAMDFELPEDLDLGSDDSGDSLSLDADDEESTAVIEAGTAVIDTEAFTAQLQDDDEAEVEATAVIEPGSNLGEADLDFGMEDTAMMDEITEDAGVELDLGDFDDDDGSLTMDIDMDADDDALSMDIDMGIDNSKTDTFAPGDFEDADDAEESSGFDDIEDLMLPDDVDEVSTKLDLARAFIDMGDAEGARSSLDEVLAEGNDEQKAEAQSLLDQL